MAMRFLLNIAILILAICLPLTAAAQMVDKAEVQEVTQKDDLGLTRQPSVPFFDMSRFDLSHSYSIGYFPGGGFSGSQALYNGTIRYQLATPLTLTLNVGVLHHPGVLFGDKSFGDNSTILPSGWLDWRPSKNFRMSIGFETVPASYYNQRGYYSYPGRSWYLRDR